MAYASSPGERIFWRIVAAMGNIYATPAFENKLEPASNDKTTSDQQHQNGPQDSTNTSSNGNQVIPSASGR